jgi:phosphohistidine phosphatase SixA
MGFARRPANQLAQVQTSIWQPAPWALAQALTFWAFAGRTIRARLQTANAGKKSEASWRSFHEGLRPRPCHPRHPTSSPPAIVRSPICPACGFARKVNLREAILNFRISRLFVAALLVAAIAFAGCHAATAQPLAGASLVRHLRQGGYVLLMRHAHSPVETPDRKLADAGNRNLERQLDDAGRGAARAMGQAIKKLHIPVGAVLSSPTYRALETVRLARLGSAQTFAQLGDGGQSMNAGAVSRQAGWLRGKVAEPPKLGSNTIIVTHMPNIQAAFAQDAAGLGDGEALVFHPDGHGGADLVARVKIEDWPTLAGN